MLIVQHGYHSFKAPTTPQTLLVQVRDDACAKWGLPAVNYTLTWNGKPLDLTSPQRFTNLVNGAKLELKLSTVTKSRIKLRLPAGEFSGTFEPTTVVQNILDAAGTRGSVYLEQRLVDPNSSLAQLGVQGSAVFSVRAQVQAQEPKAAPRPEHKAQQPASLPGPVSEPGPVAGAASTAGAARPAAVLAHSEPPSGPTVAQARAYMDHLHSQSQPKPLLFRSTKEKLRQEKRSQQPMTIRIRLPDMSQLEGVFNPQETGEHVYDFIQTYLIDSGLVFTLETVPPGFTLLPSHNLLETPFDTRVMLALKTAAKGPFLNDKAIAQLSRQATTEAGPGPAAAVAADTPAQTAPSTASPALKKPKWLKLGKN